MHQLLVNRAIQQLKLAVLLTFANLKVSQFLLHFVHVVQVIYVDSFVDVFGPLLNEFHKLLFCFFPRIHLSLQCLFQ